MTMTAKQFWTDYFERVTTGGPVWIDYSNERVQLQTFGAVLEVMDSLLDRRVLDIGCGRGHLCRLAKVLGAREATGVDLAPSAIAKLADDHPDLVWRAGDITDAEFRGELGEFDVICSLESMQYLPVPTALDWICEMLAPGGRFVAMFPFDGCPIVQRTQARFEGRYVPPSLDAVLEWAGRTNGICWGVRGLRFREDQRLCAYDASPWTTQPQWTEAPNRIQLVVQKLGK
jgi:SAM-dependent methyltransferase